jgi:hypothetical protein
MYERINQETVNNKFLGNVLQNINSNKLPLILLIIILIIIILIILIKDYNSFSKDKNSIRNKKREGFELPDSVNYKDYYDKYKGYLTSNKSENNNNGKNVGTDVSNNIINDISNNIINDISNNKVNTTVNTINTYNNTINDLKKNINSIKNFSVTNELNKLGNSLKNKLSSNVNNKISDIRKKLFVSKDNKIANSIIILSFIFIIIILSFIFLPSFREFKTLFNQIHNVTYVILYTIFLILFLRLLPSDILESNAYYIVPITIIIAFILFTIGFQSNYVTNFNINYERIKIMLLYFCFITICITYYSINPGKYITKNFNVSLLMSSLIGIFGFTYLVILLTMPNIYENFTNSKNSTNILENVSSFSKYGSGLFILFLITITVLISKYPGGFFNNKSTSAIVMPLLVLVCVFWSILLIATTFSSSNSDGNNIFLESKISLIKKTLLVLLGLSISGIIIAYIVYNIQNLSNKSNIPSFILSIILIVSILILIYKTFFVKLPSPEMNRNKNSFFELIINVLFFIPCLFAGVFDTIMKMFITEYNSNSLSTYIILLIVIILIILYFVVIPRVQNSFNRQGGKQLLEKPVNTNRLITLSSYRQLNGSDALDYKYAISFWVFIESLPPNMNPNYNKFTSILNYGGKPNILYKADTTTLMITMDQEQLAKKGTTKFIEYDANGNRIIYTNKNFLLQKWNNIIVNYNGGTLDIFLNGELVKSSIEVIPYMKYDTLTIGSNGGIHGGVCNLIYFKNPLALTNIYYIYNSLKNTEPPVVNYYNKTIISDKL